MSLNITTLVKTAKKIQRAHPDDIFDIVLFGSAMKGKDKPGDIDILIIFTKEVNKKIERALHTELAIPTADVQSITLKELEGNGFVAKEGIYLEGLSLVHNQPLRDSLGFYSVAFIKYSLESIQGSPRVKFYYALQGRKDQKGFLQEIGATRYTDNTLLCPYSLVEPVKTFLDHWNIGYKVTPALVPKRLIPILFSK